MHEQDPEITPSVLSIIPDILQSLLVDLDEKSKGGDTHSYLISSNALANRFILSRWGIRPSQRRRYKNLFSTIRRHCRILFEYYLARNQFVWSDGKSTSYWGVYKYDRIRGNLILGFVRIDSNHPFIPRLRPSR